MLSQFVIVLKKFESTTLRLKKLINKMRDNGFWGEKMISSAVAQLEWIGLGIGLLCLVPIVWFIISILLCIWVYRDAESRGMGGVLWLIVVILTGIIGLIIYLAVRKPKTDTS
jgi:hypothetical protein